MGKQFVLITPDFIVIGEECLIPPQAIILTKFNLRPQNIGKLMVCTNVTQEEVVF